MGGIVGVMNEIVIDHIGEEAVAVSVEIDQGLKHQNKKKDRIKYYMLIAITPD